MLAPELNAHIGKRLHVGLLVGPTLNLIDTDLDATAAWHASGSSRPIKTYHANESGIKVKLGVAAQTTVQYDLTPRLFLQASASYRYVQNYGVSAGFARANVDVGSWQAAVGIGYRF